MKDKMTIDLNIPGLLVKRWIFKNVEGTVVITI